MVDFADLFRLSDPVANKPYRGEIDMTSEEAWSVSRGEQIPSKRPLVRWAMGGPSAIEGWNEYAEQHPIIECDLATGLVLVYPANEYLDDLSDRTREKTRRLYNRITRQGSMMVFIRDRDNEILQSYIIPKTAPAKKRARKPATVRSGKRQNGGRKADDKIPTR